MIIWGVLLGLFVLILLVVLHEFRSLLLSLRETASRLRNLGSDFRLPQKNGK